MFFKKQCQQTQTHRESCRGLRAAATVCPVEYTHVSAGEKLAQTSIGYFFFYLTVDCRCTGNAVQFVIDTKNYNYSQNLILFFDKQIFEQFCLFISDMNLFLVSRYFLVLLYFSGHYTRYWNKIAGKKNDYDVNCSSNNYKKHVDQAQCVHPHRRGPVSLNEWKHLCGRTWMPGGV